MEINHNFEVIIPARAVHNKIISNIKIFLENNIKVTFIANQNNNRFIPIVINNCLKKKKFPLSHCEQYRDFIWIS